MKRLILLDSGPLGMVTNPKAVGSTLDCQLWLKIPPATRRKSSHS
jgi:hypothetical protein